MALEKFKTAAAKWLKCEDWQVLLRTIYTVYKHALVPESDRQLKLILVDMWVLASDKRATGLPPDVTVSLFGDVPEFAMELTRNLTSGYDGWVLSKCKNCGSYGNRRRAQLPSLRFVCTRCPHGGGEFEEEVVLCGGMTIKKFW